MVNVNLKTQMTDVKEAEQIEIPHEIINFLQKKSTLDPFLFIVQNLPDFLQFFLNVFNQLVDDVTHRSDFFNQSVRLTCH